MVTELILENIGGLQGKKKFKLVKGKVNVLVGSNRIGKSSVTKGLTLLLSAGEDGLLFSGGSDEHSEALALGIVSSPRNPRQGIVNIHSDQATVSLEGDGKKETISLKKNGQVQELPKKANANFMYAGSLCKYSRIFRNLGEGINDFRWMVQKLSYAKYYDQYNDEMISPALIELEDFHNQAVAKNRGLEQIKKKHEDTLSELQQLQTQYAELTRTNEELGPEMAELQRQKKNRGADAKMFRDDVRKSEERLKNYEAEIGELKKQKAKIDSELKQVLKELTELKESHAERLRKNETRVSELSDERSKLQGKLNVYQPADDLLQKSGQATVTCPLCNKGALSKTHIKTTLKDINAGIEECSQEIVELNREILDANHRKKELSEDVEELGERSHALKMQLERIDDQEIQSIRSRLEGNRKNLKKKEVELKEIESKIKKLDEKYDKPTQAKFGALKKKIGVLEERQRGLEEEIDHSRIDLKGYTFEPGVAMKILGSQIALLKGVQEYCTSQSEDQQQKARKEFNETIGNMMARLNFDDLKDVRLNQDNQLFVERKDPKTGQHVLQDVKTLATSEKLTIAILLQIALKETYLDDIGYLILDDIEDFDKDRKKAVLEYLKEKARENDWCVLVTQLDEKENSLTMKTI